MANLRHTLDCGTDQFITHLIELLVLLERSSKAIGVLKVELEVSTPVVLHS